MLIGSRSGDEYEGLDKLNEDEWLNDEDARLDVTPRSHATGSLCSADTVEEGNTGVLDSLSELLRVTGGCAGDRMLIGGG